MLIEIDAAYDENLTRHFEERRAAAHHLTYNILEKLLAEQFAPRLIVMCGAPGSGKTTMAKELEKNCKTMGLRTLILDTTFRRPDARTRLLGIAQATRTPLTVVRMNCKIKTLRQRNEARRMGDKPGTYVPSEVVEEAFSQIEQLCPTHEEFKGVEWIDVQEGESVASVFNRLFCPKDHMDLDHRTETTLVSLRRVLVYLRALPSEHLNQTSLPQICETIGINKTTLTRAIKYLETETGTALFEDAKHLHPGQLLRRFLQDPNPYLLRPQDFGKENVSPLSDEHERTLRIVGCGSSILSAVPQALGELSEPLGPLELIERRDALARSFLRQGLADVSITRTREPDLGECLFQERVYLIHRLDDKQQDLKGRQVWEFLEDRHPESSKSQLLYGPGSLHTDSVVSPLLEANWTQAQPIHTEEPRRQPGIMLREGNLRTVLRLLKHRVIQRAFVSLIPQDIELLNTLEDTYALIHLSSSKARWFVWEGKRVPNLIQTLQAQGQWHDFKLTGWHIGKARAEHDAEVKWRG